MQIVYKISEQDYVDAHSLFVKNERPYRRISRRLMPWLGIFIVIVQVIYLVTVPKPELGMVVAGSALGFFLIYCGFALRRYFRKLYRKDHRFKHEYTASISDDGIRIVTPFSDGQLKWNAFVRFLESSNIFMIFIAEWNFLIFPKRAFGTEEVRQFRSLLSQKIPTPSVA